MSILGGSFETFFVFLCISVEPQHRDKIPQLRLITLYEQGIARGLVKNLEKIFFPHKGLRRNIRASSYWNGYVQRGENGILLQQQKNAAADINSREVHEAPFAFIFVPLRSFEHSFISLLVRSYSCLHSFVRSFVCSSVRPCLFVRLRVLITFISFYPFLHHQPDRSRSPNII